MGNQRGKNSSWGSNSRPGTTEFGGLVGARHRVCSKFECKGASFEPGCQSPAKTEAASSAQRRQRGTAAAMWLGAGCSLEQGEAAAPADHKVAAAADQGGHGHHTLQQGRASRGGWREGGAVW